MNLISGKEVALAILDGKELLWRKMDWNMDELEPVSKSMWNIEELVSGKTISGDLVEFYLKPRTITLNGIEVPTPFEPKEGDHVWCMSDYQDGWVGRKYRGQYSALGYWRTEEEIKQVVEALRSVFK